MSRRSAANRRGIALFVVAIIVGVLVYLFAVPDRPPSGPVSAGGDGTVTPTAPPTVAPIVDPNSPRIITFPGAAGSPPDAKVWNYETGGNGWGNGELETYTTSTSNAFVDGHGNLVIRALRETKRGTDGITRRFTSARITTAKKVVVQPGSYVSATFTAPVGPGIWPAFWLIGANIDEVGWPRAGELDVFEGDAPAPTLAQTAIHLSSAANPSTDKPYGPHSAGGTVDLGQRLDAAPHEYGVYFDGEVVRFFIDHKQNMVVTAAEAVASGRSWPFAGPQYLILNVAITSSGAADTADFPQDLIVSNIAIWSQGIPFAVS